MMTKLVTRRQLREIVALHGGCIVTQFKGKWGPYAYHVTKHRGKQSWNYLGKITEDDAEWLSLLNADAFDLPLILQRTDERNRKWRRIDGQLVRRARHVMELHLGRRLKENEVVHHIDGDKANDNIENLQVMTEIEHLTLHRRMNSRLRRYHESSFRKERRVGKSAEVEVK